MSALVLALAVLSAAATAGPAPAESEVWITIDREVLVAFERGGEPWETSPLGADLTLPREQVVAVALTEARLDELSAFIHERYRRCAGFIAHASREEALEAAARALYEETLEQIPAPIPYTIDNGGVVKAMVAQVQESNIRTTITDLSAFFTRYHNCLSGNLSATWIRDKWASLVPVGRPDVTVQLYNHTGYTTLQPSVILTIQGTTFPSEVVVLGGHQDSIAGTNCSLSQAPGADDDASGIATLTEVIRVAMALGYQPQRTVKFMAYAAEEIGLRGSAQIAQQHADQGVNVVGVIQFDMTNYAPAGAQYDIVMFTDFTNAAQNAFITDLANLYVPNVGTVVPRVTSACGYGCSDHASWFNRGFPASFPFESRFNEHNPFIHTSNDTLAVSGNHANRTVPFAHLGAAYMAEIAKGGFTARLEIAGETARARTAVRRAGRRSLAR